VAGAVASVAFGLAARTQHTALDAAKARASSLTYETEGGVRNPEPGTRNAELGKQNSSGSWPVYVAIAISGLCALGAEVIWTRLLSLMLGATVYTFSIILAVFLIGLGIGSGLGSLLARTAVRPRIALGCCQALLVAAIAWAAYVLACSLPYWPIDPTLATNPWFTFQLDLLRCAWAILPAAGLWGASFPLALAAVAAPGQDAGRLVGGVYAANTVGAILGALADGDANLFRPLTDHLLELALAHAGGRNHDFLRHRPPDDFIDMIRSGTWTDRNKSSSVLWPLTQSRNPQLLAAVVASIVW